VKILLISWYFPPSNTIAAVRLGKLAKHLLSSGHGLRVLTAENPPYPATLKVEVDESHIDRAAWKDITSLPDWAVSLARLVGVATLTREKATETRAEPTNAAPPANPQPARNGRFRSIRRKLSTLYELLFGFPDIRVGWIPDVRRKGLQIIRDWRPDILFASGPPFTTLLAGYLLSRASGVPLVVEFRDRWWDDPYYPRPRWREKCERWLESRIIRQAAGLTTVSEPWAVTFRERYGKPVAVILNGYVAEDFHGTIGQGWPDPHVLRIAYTGGIYPGYRDPSPLFRAIGSSTELSKRVEVHFYGSDPRLLSGLACEHGVEKSVIIHDRVDHAEALRVQQASDILLLMQWDNPREQGNVPGKFAEYFGARRPILVLGLADGVPATEVKKRLAGAAVTSPDAIAQWLNKCLVTKQKEGKLAPLSDQAVAGLSRAEQAVKLEQFLTQLLQTPGVAP
jgi:glycosyltransferase involved in cell wall biosynthesis